MLRTWVSNQSVNVLVDLWKRAEMFLNVESFMELKALSKSGGHAHLTILHIEIHQKQTTNAEENRNAPTMPHLPFIVENIFT